MEKYKDKHCPIGERVEDLLSRMTLEEKVWQLTCLSNDFTFGAAEFGNSGRELVTQEVLHRGVGQIAILSHGKNPYESAVHSNEIQKKFIKQGRLGIPVIFHEEALHGHMAPDATSYPSALAMAATFNTELIHAVYSRIAHEVRSRGGHLVLTPNLDIARDPRWGRTEETYGEDPYLASRMGVAAVTGFQGGEGELAGKKHVASAVKHFVAHGSPEGGINIAPPNVDDRTLRDIMLKSFKAAIQEAGAKGVMAAYSEINGEPVHASRGILTGLLREELGFNGIVVSDWFGIDHLYQFQFVAGDDRQSALLAITAGVDCELPKPMCYPHLLEHVAEGRLEETVIDRSVRRVLQLKFELGLFDDPFVNPGEAAAIVNNGESRQLARQVAEEAMILLKNEQEILPVDCSRFRTIAVIGPNAAECHLGNYVSERHPRVSVLEGIKSHPGSRGLTLLYSEGVRITKPYEEKDKDHRVYLEDDRVNAERIQKAIEVARQADLTVLCLGGTPLTAREGWADFHSGDNSDLELPAMQNELFEAVKALGRPVVVLLTGGGPYAVRKISEKADAILECFYLGQETGHAVAGVLFGTVNPSGKLPISIPRSTGQLPVFYNHKFMSRQRGYLFEDTAPLYPFGFGLSYTRFEYGGLVLGEGDIAKGESVTVTFELTNTGLCGGYETAQLYVRDRVSSVTRPVKELKDFKKVFLQCGQTKKVEFLITAEKLSFFDIHMNYVVEPGDFEIMVGSSSEHLPLRAVLTVKA